MMPRVALLLGGPSEERAISLNSARSVADHLEADVSLELILYFDKSKRPYAISRAMLYSNTPEDFEFKLSRCSPPLRFEEMAKRLRMCDIAFPVMHGVFGEDGEIQAILDRVGIRYIGSTPGSCRIAYDKYEAHVALKAAGIETVPSTLLCDTADIDELRALLRMTVPNEQPLVLKPAAGGSSIDVTACAGIDEAVEQARPLLTKHRRIVAQPWMEGIELTTVVLEGPNGPVALPPVEVEVRNASRPLEIFDFRRKYLVTDDVRYHCPPRFPHSVVDKIRRVSEQVFRALGLRDFARIDGWVDTHGKLFVSDVNPISGMEQNSFLFIQAAQIGMTHRDVLRFLLANACRRAGLPIPHDHWKKQRRSDDRTPVAVLFGGNTAERQVSVLSGTNVWLKLMGSERFDPSPYLWDVDGDIWLLSYATALRHTVEEISAACQVAVDAEPGRRRLADDAIVRLALQPWQRQATVHPPSNMTLDDFLSTRRFVFNALHGGAGEDGSLQLEFERRGIAFNGSGSEASSLCMDKYATSQRLEGYEDLGLTLPRRIKVSMPRTPDGESVEALWSNAVHACGGPPVIVKPVADGCSVGIVPLNNCSELKSYIEEVSRGASKLASGSFSLLAADQVVELPTSFPAEVMFEEFMETDDVGMVDVDVASPMDGPPRQGYFDPTLLLWGEARDTRWIEVTVGVLGERGRMRAFTPSMTIARQGVLSVEEKFMGGTGVNMTPPPAPPLGRVREAAIERTKELISYAANLLGIEGYARIDAFMHRESGAIAFIEANTLPALTPSTVLYHQALAEQPPLFPLHLLEHIIGLGLARQRGEDGEQRPVSMDISGG